MTRALAYGFGLDDDFGDFDNCPDVVTIFCEDAHGALYRYVRTRAGDTEVKAKDDQSIVDVPIDSFPIEYFRQGELSRVAEDPLRNPGLLQDFLDRHASLADLVESERSIVTSLRENASRLVPLETAFSQLADRRKHLKDIEAKIKIAEEGNLREIASGQNQLASEKIAREAIEEIANDYTRGWTLSGVLRDLDSVLQTCGTLTEDETSTRVLGEIRATLEGSNEEVRRIEKELNDFLKATATELRKLVAHMKANHQRMSAEAASRLADLKARGVATDISGLERLIADKASTVKNIAAVAQRQDELKECRAQRAILNTKLRDVRATMTRRRKDQLAAINKNLSIVIKDYTIFIKYDDAGMTANFVTFLQEKMSGTYMQDSTIEGLCARVTPSELAELILGGKHEEIAERTDISSEWAQKLVGKLRYWNLLLELEVLAKPPKPVITVYSKGNPRTPIPVLQLSDGQRHTILLTIAMLVH